MKRVGVPVTCPVAPPELLDPRASWKEGPDAYREEVRELVAAFHERVNSRYAGIIHREVLDAGPRIP